jgi:hypothetical protein
MRGLVAAAVLLTSRAALACPPPPYDEDGVTFGIGIAMLIMSILGAGAYASISEGAAQRAHPKALLSVSAELVRRVAVTRRRRAVLALLCWPFALLLLKGLPNVNLIVVLASIPIGFSVVAAWTLRRMRQLLDSLVEPDVSVVYDGQHYVFDRQRNWLVLYPWQLARVTKAAVPVAKVR